MHLEGGDGLWGRDVDGHIPGQQQDFPFEDCHFDDDDCTIQ